MVVLRVALLERVLVRGEPTQILAEPSAYAFLLGKGEGGGLVEDFDRACDLDEVQGVDHALRAPGSDAVDGLGVTEVRGHARLGIHEPRAQVAAGVHGVAPITGETPGRGQRRHLHAQPHQGAAVLDEVVGVRHPVPLDIGPVGVLGIGPPVVALGEELVGAAGAARRLRGGDRAWILVEKARRRRQNAWPLEGRHVHGGCGGGQQEKGGHHGTGRIWRTCVAREAGY